LAMDSRMSLSVTTLQWHTYIVSRLTESANRATSQRQDPGHWMQVSLT
jgi:hypothetical protein